MDEEEDAATAEISRTQLWQWLRHGAVLDDGRVLDAPPYVFDCTGPGGIVTRAAQVGSTPLSAEQRVVWTHFQTTDGTAPDARPWWSCGTNLLRLQADRDGVDGVSWFIPMGHTLSVGVSVDAAAWPTSRLDDAALMDALAAAWERRGVRFRGRFPEMLPLQQLHHTYFVADRAYGSNWLLVGPSFAQPWFLSSAGLWTIILAAKLAPQLLAEPL